MVEQPTNGRIVQSDKAAPKPTTTGINFSIKDTEFLLKMFGKIQTFAGQELEQGSNTLTKVKLIHDELMNRVYAL